MDPLTRLTAHFPSQISRRNGSSGAVSSRGTLAFTEYSADSAQLRSFESEAVEAVGAQVRLLFQRVMMDPNGVRWDFRVYGGCSAHAGAVQPMIGTIALGIPPVGDRALWSGQFLPRSSGRVISWWTTRDW